MANRVLLNIFVLFFVLQFVFYVNAKQFFFIESNPLVESVIIFVSPFTPYYNWYAPYYGPSIEEPSATFQTTNCISGQRDVIFGFDSTVLVNSVSKITFVNGKISVSVPVNYGGAVYLQYDGDDTNGQTSNFPGAFLNSPGIGSGISSTLAESDGNSIDFTSFDRSIGIELVIGSDQLYECILKAIDSAFEENELVFPVIFSMNSTYLIRFDDVNWSNPIFDWTTVGAFQVKLSFENAFYIAVDTQISSITIIGYEVSGNVFVDSTCSGTITALVQDVELNLYSGSTGLGPVLSTAVTDVDGAFAFFPKFEGDYTICLAGSASLLVCSSMCLSFTLENNTDITNLEFSLLPPSSTATNSPTKSPTLSASITPNSFSPSSTESFSITDVLTTTTTTTITTTVTTTPTEAASVNVNPSPSTIPSISISRSPQIPLAPIQQTHQPSNPKLPSPTTVNPYGQTPTNINVELPSIGFTNIFVQPCVNSNNQVCIGSFYVDPVSPSGTIIIAENPNFDIISQSNTEDIKSIILSVRLEDNLTLLGETVEICIEPNQDNADEDDLCLGFLDESLQPPEWICEDSELVEKFNGLFCGNTNHFTNFALLLDGGNNDDCDDSCDWVTRNSWGDFILIMSCFLFCVLFGIVFILLARLDPAKRLIYGEEGMRISTARSLAKSSSQA